GIGRVVGAWDGPGLGAHWCGPLAGRRWSSPAAPPRRPGTAGRQLADLEPIWQYTAPGGPREIYDAYQGLGAPKRRIRLYDAAAPTRLTKKRDITAGQRGGLAKVGSRSLPKSGNGRGVAEINHEI